MFTGSVFKDYLDTDFKMFLRREGIARVLDPAKDPRKLYTMPELPVGGQEATPATVRATPARRPRGVVQRSPPMSPKSVFAQERFEQSVRTERRVIQEKYDAWDRDCERAFSYLHDAIPAEDRRRVARETTDDLQVMIRVLTDHHKHRTIFDKLGVLLEFVQLSVKADLTAEQYVDVVKEYFRVLSKSSDSGGFGDSITIESLCVAIFLKSLASHNTFDNFVEAEMKSDSIPTLLDVTERFAQARVAKPGVLATYIKKSQDLRRNPRRSSRDRYAQDHPERALLTDEEIHLLDNNLCFNCKLPGHKREQCYRPGGG